MEDDDISFSQTKFEAMTDDEKVQYLMTICSNLEQDTKQKLDLCQQLLPNPIQYLKIAQKYHLAKEKRRNLQRKVLSIYLRYPNIAKQDQPQFLSADINFLRAQIDIAEKRKVSAQDQLTQINKDIEQIKEKLIQVQKETRDENLFFEQCIQPKVPLLQEEQSTFRKFQDIYQKFSQPVTNDPKFKLASLQENYSDIKEVYEVLTSIRDQVFEGSSGEFLAFFQKYNTLVSDLFDKCSSYLEWWRDRRLQAKYKDLKEFLLSILDNSEKCHSRYVQLLDDLSHRVQKTKEKQLSLQQIIQQTSDIYNEREKEAAEKKQISQPLELPPDIIARLTTAREELQYARNQGAALNIQTQVLLSESVTERAEREFEETYNKYLQKVRELVELEKEIEKQKAIEMEKKKEKEKEKIFINRRKSSSNMSSSKISKVSSKNFRKSQFFMETFQQFLNEHEGQLMILQDSDPIQVSGANLNILIQLLFHPDNKDPMFSKALLVLVHSVQSINIQEFITNVLTEYSTTKFKETKLESLQKFVTDWLTWFESDFSEEGIKDDILPLLEEASMLDYETFFAEQAKLFSLSYISDDSIPYDPSENELIFSAPPSVIVQHFTYWELGIMRKIKPSEYINCAWVTNDKWIKSPCIMQMIDHFNYTTKFIVLSIILTSNFQMRVKIIDRWIQIMEAAYELLNFQFIFEIFGALCNPSIKRLKRTWEQVSEDSKMKFEKFQKMTNPIGRMAAYRKEYTKAPFELVLPYIGAELTSMIYINDGNPTKKFLEENHEEVFNFQKFHLYCEEIEMISAKWMSKFKFTLNEQLLRRITTLAVIERTDEELFELSSQLIALEEKVESQKNK